MATSVLKRTPLHDCHREAGARLVEFAGWEMPVQYGGVVEEHRAVRGAAGLFDVSHMGEIAVRGPEAEALLQRLTPNDVGKLAPGRAHYSGLLTETGTYVDDVLVYRLGPDEFLLVVNAANAERDFAWIAERAAGADARVEDVSDRWALLALQGPRALEILAPLARPEIGELRYYGFTRGEVDGRPALLSRTGYTGEDGFEVYLAPADAPAVWRLLLAAGAGRGLVPAGLGARDTLRLEAGMALYGHEIDDTTTPFEAGLDWVVKLDKGDFVGRGALVAQRRQGMRRKLVGFEIEGRGIARQGHAVVDAGEPSGARRAGRATGSAPGDRLEPGAKAFAPIGRVTSGTWSPTFEKPLGMAYVPVELAVPGARLAIDVRGRALPAVVVDLPFYRRPR